MSTEHEEILQPIDPAEFRVPASDDKGHDRRISLRIPPGWTAQVSKIVDSKWFPIENHHQLYRAFIKWGLERVDKLAPIPNSDLHRTNAILELLVEDEEQDKFIEVISKMGKRLGEHLAKGNVGMARVLVRRVMDEVERMPEGHWKGEYKKEIEGKFGYLLKGNQETAASLFELEEENV